MIWGDPSATDAMVRAFEERNHVIVTRENGLRFELYAPGTSRRGLKTATPLAVLYCPLTPAEPFLWLTPELAGCDPRVVPPADWPGLLPYAAEGSTVPFELARDVIETLTPQLTTAGGR